MITKNSDITVKIFMVVVAVILVGLIIAWSTGVFRDKRNDLNEGTRKINNVINSMAEFDMLVYDGGTITGSILMELIKDAADGKLDVNITYRTLQMGENAEPISYPSPEPAKNDGKYINPRGRFIGEVTRNDNEVITGVIFTQVD